MRIIYLQQNHKRTDICMRGTKRGRLPRYIIIILLRFISTLFHDPIFNTLSQFSSLLDINSTAYSTRLLHTTSLLFLYTDFMFLFLFISHTVSLTRKIVSRSPENWRSFPNNNDDQSSGKRKRKTQEKGTANIFTDSFKFWCLFLTPSWI